MIGLGDIQSTDIVGVSREDKERLVLRTQGIKDMNGLVLRSRYDESLFVFAPVFFFVSRRLLFSRETPCQEALPCGPVSDDGRMKAKELTKCEWPL